jgi:hypothetical protein
MEKILTPSVALAPAVSTPDRDFVRMCFRNLSAIDDLLRARDGRPLRDGAVISSDDLMEAMEASWRREDADGTRQPGRWGGNWDVL